MYEFVYACVLELVYMSALNVCVHSNCTCMRVIHLYMYVCIAYAHACALFEVCVHIVHTYACFMLARIVFIGANNKNHTCMCMCTCTCAE